MVEFYQLPEHDRRRAIRAAMEWREKHTERVLGLMEDGHLAYAPSGSDIFRPELWRPAMWRWLARQTDA